MIRQNKAQWLDLVNEQASSGLSAVEFCRRNGLNPKYFSLRHRRFAKLNEDLRSLQNELFDEAEAQNAEQAPKSEKLTVPLHTRKKLGGRQPLPKNLPRIDQLLNEASKRV